MNQEMFWGLTFSGNHCMYWHKLLRRKFRCSPPLSPHLSYCRGGGGDILANFFTSDIQIYIPSDDQARQVSSSLNYVHWTLIHTSTQRTCMWVLCHCCVSEQTHIFTRLGSHTHTPSHSLECIYLSQIKRKRQPGGREAEWNGMKSVRGKMGLLSQIYVR